MPDGPILLRRRFAAAERLLTGMHGITAISGRFQITWRMGCSLAACRDNRAGMRGDTGRPEYG